MTDSSFRSLLTHAFRRQAFRFVAVGIGNTLFSYGLYALLLYVGLGVPTATFLALVAGVCLSFATQGKLVFGVVSGGSLIRFLVSWGALYALYVAVVLGLQRLGIDPYRGGLAATAINTAISFFVMRDFVFRRTGIDGDE